MKRSPVPRPAEQADAELINPRIEAEALKIALGEAFHRACRLVAAVRVRPEQRRQLRAAVEAVRALATKR